jgi:hypothetical protein
MTSGRTLLRNYFQWSPSLHNVDVVPERSEGDELTISLALPAKRWMLTKVATETLKRNFTSN